MAVSTSIKVPTALRDRINRDARARGLTAAGFLEKLLDDHDREQMLDGFGHAFAAADEDYRAESARWVAIETDWPRG